MSDRASQHCCSARLDFGDEVVLASRQERLLAAPDGERSGTRPAVLWAHLVRMGSTLLSPVTESTTVERIMNGFAVFTTCTHSSGDMKL